MKKNGLNTEMPYMSPLIDREEASKKKGFTESFEVNADSKLVCSAHNRKYAASAVKIVNYYRFEGMSDPADSNILYEMETNDGLKGILTTPFGSDCPAHVASFVAAIPQIEKKHEGVGPVE